MFITLTPFSKCRNLTRLVTFFSLCNNEVKNWTFPVLAGTITSICHFFCSSVVRYIIHHEFRFGMMMGQTNLMIRHTHFSPAQNSPIRYLEIVTGIISGKFFVVIGFRSQIKKYITKYSKNDLGRTGTFYGRNRNCFILA